MLLAADANARHSKYFKVQLQNKIDIFSIINFTHTSS